MKIILLKLIISSYFFVFSNSVLAEDLRDLRVGSDIRELPERGYTNFKCLNSKKIKNWKAFTNCEKNEKNFHLITFEYDERYALNENFEGTQVSGHPVLINIAVDEKGILNEININTDPKAPFYFRKQSHLMWLRIYHKYGSEDWQCVNKKQLNNHIKIGKKYINKVCTKLVNNKIIKLHSQFYFVDDKSKKENLVSKTFLQIKFDNKT